jgi:hypothetical protein
VREKHEEQAELYTYPSLEVVEVGSIPETELFMVWASGRPEPELSYFGKTGHTDEDGPGDFAKQLGLALGEIRKESGLFDAVHKVGHRILRAVEINHDAEGFALIANLPITEAADDTEPDDEEADEEELQEEGGDTQEAAKAPTRRITKRNAKGQIEDSEAL